MCDYSLEYYRSRPARAGEKYETHRFPSHTIGMVSPADPMTAVCMECDMRLKLEGIPATVQNDHKVSAEEEVTFVRLDHGVHRDGVRFDNGAEVALQQLGPGVKAMLIETLETPAAAAERITEPAE